MKTIVLYFLGDFNLENGGRCELGVCAKRYRHRKSIGRRSPEPVGSQWPGPTTLQGFTTDISVNHGFTVNFKIQANTNNLRIDIYRLGYYQGNSARLITTIRK